MAPSSLYINVETKWTTGKTLKIEIFIIIKDECFDNFDLIRIITYSSYTIGLANLCLLSWTEDNNINNFINKFGYQYISHSC